VKYLLYILSISYLATSCTSPARDPSNPDELVIGLAISEDYEKTVGKIEALQSYLAQALDMDVKIFKVTNGSAVIEAIKADKVHLGSTGAFSYIVAQSKVGITPLVSTAAATADTAHSYWSCLIVPRNSPIDNIGDLLKRTSSLTLAWAYPTSTSGHLVPRNYFRSKGISPDDFKEVMVSENHVASLYNCITGKVDVAAISSNILRHYLDRGKVKPEEFKIIWESSPIPRGNIFASKSLNPVLIEKIQQALVEMHRTNPEAARKIHYQYDYPVKYVAVDDTHYDSLRAMARAIALIP